jgi:hypothetical protein
MVVFATERAELARQFKAQLRVLEQNGGLWAAWPKKSSGVTTDTTTSIERRSAPAPRSSGSRPRVETVPRLR